MNLKSLVTILIVVFVGGCQKESIAPNIEEPNPLLGFLESFLAEAKTRGVKIDTIGMNLELGGPVGQGGCGYGVPRTPGSPPSVQICEICTCWREDFTFKKELLFHEFGHALLNRGHDNLMLPNGSKRSIMSQSIGGVFGLNAVRQKYYIDELFDPSTPIPDWAK